MDQLQSELLLSIFKQLDSNEMVKMTRVCKTWSDIINENQSPWRSLVLPDRYHRIEGPDWDASIIELFDRKSQSTLQRVSIRIYGVHWEEVRSVKAVLMRSKYSLQYLHLSDRFTVSLEKWISSLEDLTWKLPNLVHFVIGGDWNPSPTRIVLVQDSQSRKPSASLRALCIPFAKSLFHSKLHIIDKVASLQVGRPLSSSEWRRILEKPAQTLKDLKISVKREEEDAPPRPQSSLDFPNLRVLQLSSFDGRFPSWLKIPSSSTFIDRTYDSLPIDLPSVSTVWAEHLGNIQVLQERCPVLAELRIDSGSDQKGNKSDLLSMLRTRKRHVKDGAEVDGVKMIPLKTLVINFHIFTEHEISQLKELVQEVVDLKSVDNFIEVEM